MGYKSGKLKCIWGYKSGKLKCIWGYKSGRNLLLYNTFLPLL